MNFCDRFSKNIQISSFAKICPVGGKSFNVDRQTETHTDMTTLTVSFAILWTQLKDRQWNQMVRTRVWSKRKSSYTRKMITQAILFFSHLYRASCVLSKFFYYQLMHKNNCFKRSNKIHIKTAPTCFGVITVIRERTTWAC